jgi:hypothetical protein
MTDHLEHLRFFSQSPTKVALNRVLSGAEIDPNFDPLARALSGGIAAICTRYRQ